jgi:hypothetical protein
MFMLILNKVFDAVLESNHFFVCRCLFDSLGVKAQINAVRFILRSAIEYGFLKMSVDRSLFPIDQRTWHSWSTLHRLVHV